MLLRLSPAILTSLFLLLAGSLLSPSAADAAPKTKKPAARKPAKPASAAAGAPEAPLAKGDANILDMAQAFRNGDRKRLTALLPLAKGHLLEPWAAYWELRARLDSAGLSEVQEFLRRYAGTYQEDRLRNDWLLVLGQRRDWAAFSAEHGNFRMADDREVTCYALAADYFASGVAQPAAVKQAWYAQREADDGCNFIASALYEAKKLTEQDVWHKARLAMEANKPRMTRATAEIISGKAASQVDDINTNVAKYLSAKQQAGSHASKEYVVLALLKQASTDPEGAAGAMVKTWDAQLTSEQRSWVWGAIGKFAGQRFTGAPLAYFANAKDAEMTDEHLAWKVRAALRAGKWKDVLTAIKAMSPEAQQDPAWVYWRARGLLAQAQNEAERAEGVALLESIASVRGFYEQLAMEELGRRIPVMPQVEPALTQAEKQEARKNPGLQRALYAINLGLRGEGVREWNYFTNLHTKGGMDDRTLLAAAAFACEREVWDRCINTSERTKTLLDMEQRYPMPFKTAVVAQAKQIGLDAAYAYGVMRQESRFVTDARSHVGAGGLMQVMPATARWTAKKIGLTDFQPAQLKDSAVNIVLGTNYLKLVLDNFGGSMPLAAAAYNAGPGRPRNWRGQAGAPTLEAAIWAESVPFTETRDYVKKVLANTTIYAGLISGQSQSLKALLGTVGPREAGKPDLDPELP
jgi:soluble lytic murein transglycosylase